MLIETANPLSLITLYTPGKFDNFGVLFPDWDVINFCIIEDNVLPLPLSSTPTLSGVKDKIFLWSHHFHQYSTILTPLYLDV